MNIEHWALNIEHWTLSGCKFNISSFILPLRMCLPATVPICTCTCICTGSYCTSGNHRSDVRLSLQYIPGDWHRLAEFFHLTIAIISMTWPIIIIIIVIVAQEECSTRQSVETSRLKTSSVLTFLTQCMFTFHTLCTFHTFLPHPHTFKFKCNLWKKSQKWIHCIRLNGRACFGNFTSCAWIENWPIPHTRQHNCTKHRTCTRGNMFERDSISCVDSIGTSLYWRGHHCLQQRTVQNMAKIYTYNCKQ